jgi:hypothetical protein
MPELCGKPVSDAKASRVYTLLNKLTLLWDDQRLPHKRFSLDGQLTFSITVTFAITMNQQGGTNANLGGGGGGGYIPAPRQDMEYICAGTIQNPSSQGAVLFLNTKTVERRMRSSRESRYVVESAVIALCTRRERNEVRFS